MINNFELIKSLLKFEDKNDFYFLQIIKRRKENPEMGSNNATINYYYIYSLEQLTKLEPEIIEICNTTKSRAYIHLNRRNAHKVGLKTLGLISEHILNEDYHAIKNAYNTCCGKYGSDPDKKWLLDIDYKDLNTQDLLP